MKITRLTVENVLGLKLIELDNLGNVVSLAGKNGAGKSRIITCLLAALQYGSVSPDKRKEILKEDGEITVKIHKDAENQWTVKRKIKNGKASLSVKHDGSGLSGNQEILTNFIGQNFVDLGKFLNMKPKEIEAEILKIAGLSEPLEEFEQKRKVTFDERTAIGRSKEAIGYTDLQPDKVEAVDVTALFDEIQEKQKSNDGLNKRKEFAESNKLQTQSLLKKSFDEVSRLEILLATEKQKIEAQEDNLKNNNAELQSLSKEVTHDLAVLNEKMAAASETNSKAVKRTNWEESRKKWVEKQSEYDAFTTALEVIDAEKLELIKGAQFPVEGLSYSDEGITYNGNTLISDGEHRLIAFQIAKQLKGDLAIATFENFALLDPDHQAEVIKDCNEAGFQVFVELVSGGASNDEGVFYIEDGGLVE